MRVLGGQRDHRRRGHAVLQLDAGSQQLESDVIGMAADAGTVGLLDAVAGVHQPVSQPAVVGQEERAGRRHVEPADREQPQRRLHQVEHGAPAVRVGRRRHHSGRLVEQQAGGGIGPEPPAVDAHVVVGRDPVASPAAGR